MITSLSQNLYRFVPFLAVTAGVGQVSQTIQHRMMVFVQFVLACASDHESEIPVVGLEIGFGTRGKVGRHLDDFVAFGQADGETVATFVAFPNPFVVVKAANLRFRNIEQHAGSSATGLPTKRRFPGTVFAGLAEFDGPVVGVSALGRSGPRTAFFQAHGQHVRAVGEVT